MYQSSTVKIGTITIGGKNEVCIQSMTNTKTHDTLSTVNQIKQLYKAGCQVVRVTTQTVAEANNIKNIKLKLLKSNIDIPIIADVHYNPKIAEIAAIYADKVRINPGNYIDNNIYKSISDNEIDKQIEKNLTPLLSICKHHNTSIRIGVNHGSLSKRILYKYGNTAVGMVESIMEFITVCRNHNFNDLVLSLKASNVLVMIDANILLVKRLKSMGLSYPIHLGVTEAGSSNEGRVKSAAGIGYLLAMGIGDTIRVSLSENPTHEIPVAIKLVELFGKKHKAPLVNFKTIKIPKSATNIKPPLVITSKKSDYSDLFIDQNTNLDYSISDNELLQIYKLNYNKLNYNALVITATVEATTILLSEKNIDGIWIDNGDASTVDELAQLTHTILQVLGKRITKTEFIACPTCGRTSINVINLLEIAKEKTSHLPNIKIAIMGCAVNGPGEMADANYGFVGSSNNNVNIYKNKQVVVKHVPQDLALEKLIDIIKESGDWKEE